jgi:hypothetical protein
VYGISFRQLMAIPNVPLFTQVFSKKPLENFNVEVHDRMATDICRSDPQDKRSFGSASPFPESPAY